MFEVEDTDDYMVENYTFTKDTIVEGQIESTLNYEFNNKTHITDVLNSMLIFLQASGYNYIERLVAVKSTGEEVANDDDIDENVIDILNQVIVQLEGGKVERENKPDLKVVSINDKIKENEIKPADTD